jgi:hypothetical protein
MVIGECRTVNQFHDEMVRADVEQGADVGWFSEGTVLASPWKRPVNPACESSIATSRLSRVSRVGQTSLMLPLITPCGFDGT